MNPIIEREVRTRWRHWHAFALAFLWAAALAAVVCFAYLDHATRLEYSDDYTPEQLQDGILAAQVTGRELFKTLSMVQAGAWLFLAPMLTATGIASERERGLLESLQLSPLTGGQIIRGKLFSVLAFISLLMLSASPVLAICFFLGGVSPSDLAVATTLQFAAALTGASIGLFFSSRARRPLGALTQSLTLMAITSVLAYYILESWTFRGGSIGWRTFQEIVLLTHPVGGLWVWGMGPEMQNQMLSPGIVALSTDGFPLWSLSLMFQILVSLALLFAAARKVAKPFPAATPNERHWSDAWKARLTNRTLQKIAQQEKVELKEKAQTALLAEFTLEKFIHFRNPILQRELRGAFRLRRGALWLGLLQALGVVVITGTFLFSAWATFDPKGRADVFYSFAYLLLFGAAVFGALIGARSFTRERESGTWESISISLMAPRDIIVAKLGAPMLACIGYALPALLILAMCLRLGGSHLQGKSAATEIVGISFNGFAGTLCLLLSALWFSTSLALLLSHSSKTTVTATVKTLATLLFIYCGLVYAAVFTEDLLRIPFGEYWYAFFFGNPAPGDITDNVLLNWWHPGFALDTTRPQWFQVLPDGIMSPAPYGPDYDVAETGEKPVFVLLQTSKFAYINSVVLFAGGCLFLTILTRRLQRVGAVRERRRISFRWK